jgi:uncharacterized protein (DUF885 family)
MARDFHPVAEQIVDDLFAANPGLAEWAGEHSYDHRLPDFSDGAVRAEVAALRESADVLHEVDPDALGAEDAVDLELLSSAVDARLFALTEVREHEWNPLKHNPGSLLHSLLIREFAPAEERLDSVVARLEALPDALATAESVLSGCPAVHVETALVQVAGTVSLVRDDVSRLATQVPARAGEAAAAQAKAVAALDAHAEWLRRALAEPGRDPRLGRRLWEAKLWHSLDSDLTASALLDRAEANLIDVGERIREAAREVTGSPDPKATLDLLAADHPDDTTIVASAEASLIAATEFTRVHELVSLVDDPCIVVEMPEFARGVSVAYCNSPGPLEPANVPTFYAIAPTPADWSPEKTASFYREYNDHMVHNLTVHEAVPGHFLQLAHARKFRGSTRVRAACRSGTFIEGWAVYAEELMADTGYGGLGVRLQQLKMQLRMTINALLDQLVHCADLSEQDAMAMMRDKGFQEEGEAAGKWRRALLTSTQLSTYFVGYSEMSAIARDRPSGASQREWHDAMLAHGCPPPRHLRTLLPI